MYFADLTRYAYNKNDGGAVNVGWLDCTVKFPKGEVPDGFLRALMKYYRYPVFVSRGFHQCNLCTAHECSGTPAIEYDHIKRSVGFYEIRVFGEDGTVYAAPGMIFHYIQHHSYLPPKAFIKAVMSFDENAYEERFYKNPLYVGNRFWLEQDRTLIE